MDETAFSHGPFTSSVDSIITKENGKKEERRKKKEGTMDRTSTQTVDGSTCMEDFLNLHVRSKNACCYIRYRHKKTESCTCFNKIFLFWQASACLNIRLFHLRFTASFFLDSIILGCFYLSLQWSMHKINH